MDSNSTVALAALTLAGTTVGGIIWIVKYLAKELSADLKAHTRAAEQQKEASLKSAQASERLEQTVRKVGDQAELSAKNSQEQLLFMRKLNGKLPKLVQEKKIEASLE